MYNFLQEMSEKLGIDLTYKRIVTKQKNRANPNTDGKLDVETYFKITVFYLIQTF